MDDLTNSNPESEVSATPLAPESTDGTVPAGSEANGVAPTGEETFTRVDPKNLPPQLRQSYNDMLRDYKEKTTKISETIKSESAKASEAYRQRAEMYDQIAQQEEFVKQWNEYVQRSQSQGQEVQGDPKLIQLEAKFQEMNQKLQISELSQVADAFADAVNDKGVKLHPEFDELNGLVIGQNQTGEEFTLLRACVELSPGSNPQEKLANGYRQAKEAYNAIFESGKKAGMGRLQAKVQNGSQPPSNSTGDIISVTEKKPKNAHEALQMARKGLMVSRD